MFSIDHRPGSLSLPAPYSVASASGIALRPSPGDRPGLPQSLSSTGPVRSLGRLPTHHPDHYPYARLSTAQPWGAHPATVLTGAYRFSPLTSYQKHPYGYNVNSINMGQYPGASFCDFGHEPKPTQSYIGLIAIAILSSPEKKLVLSDIYKYIVENYSYFRSRGPGWRNSIRHNLSLNECFIKSNRSSNGKGHFWAIHPANVEDFEKGDFRRRRAQRKVRKYINKERLAAENLPKSDLKEEDYENGLIDVEITDEESVCEMADIDELDGVGEDRPKAAVGVANKEDNRMCEDKDIVQSDQLPGKRRGAFDMDTILSSNFPIVRSTQCGRIAPPTDKSLHSNIEEPNRK